MHLAEVVCVAVSHLEVEEVWLKSGERPARSQFWRWKSKQRLDEKVNINLSCLPKSQHLILSESKK